MTDVLPRWDETPVEPPPIPADPSGMDTTGLSQFVASHTGRFGTIVADPPWAYRFSTRQSDAGNNGWHGGADRHYPLMSVGQIAALPVAELAAPDCVLWLWVVNAMLPACLDVVDRWGFEYKNVLTWGKLTRKGKTAFGTGYWMRGATEHVALAVRGNPKPLRRNARSLLLSERLRHSQKPEAALRLFETLTAGPHLELFARRPRPGWTCWGGDALDSRSVATGQEESDGAVAE